MSGLYIDLLFLSRGDVKPEWEALTQKILYVLWDLKLDIGYAVRTCSSKIMREDATVITNMVDARLLAGNRVGFDEMVKMTAATLKERAFTRKKSLRNKTQRA